MNQNLERSEEYARNLIRACKGFLETIEERLDEFDHRLVAFHVFSVLDDLDYLFTCLDKIARFDEQEDRERERLSQPEID